MLKSELNYQRLNVTWIRMNIYSFYSLFTIYISICDDYLPTLCQEEDVRFSLSEIQSLPFFSLLEEGVGFTQPFIC